MKTLHLNLKKKWFDMIFSGEKKEEYREITPYFCSRFLLYKKEHKTIKWWSFFFNYEGCFYMKTLNRLIDNDVTVKDYDVIIFSNGMTPPVPRFEIEFKGIIIGVGKEEWGAQSGKIYFVTYLGEIL